MIYWIRLSRSTPRNILILNEIQLHANQIKSGVSKYFDYDFLISINPDEYHKTKETIGAQIVNILDEINK